MRIDVVVLLNPKSYWIAWWANDPRDRRVAIDICLPPDRTPDGWSFVDLELDLVRHENEVVEVQDREEFETACRNGWISPEDMKRAQITAAALEAALRSGEEPFCSEGWKRLDSIQQTHPT
jgi:predicted RNA-binding protein associated with RNAse of E/G family